MSRREDCFTSLTTTIKLSKLLYHLYKIIDITKPVTARHSRAGYWSPKIITTLLYNAQFAAITSKDLMSFPHVHTVWGLLLIENQVCRQKLTRVASLFAHWRRDLKRTHSRICLKLDLPVPCANKDGGIVLIGNSG